MDFDSHNRRQQEETFAFLMLRFQKSVGFLDKDDTAPSPMGEASGPFETPITVNASTVVNIDIILKSDTQLSVDETDDNEVRFFEDVKRMLIDHVGEIDGRYFHDSLTEIYLCIVDQPGAQHTLQERRKLAKAEVLACVKNIIEDAYIKRTRLAIEDRRLVLKLIVTLGMIAITMLKIIYGV